MAEEMREVEEELEEDSELNGGNTITLETIEEGRASRPLTSGPLTNSLAAGREDSPADRGRTGARGREPRRSSRSRSRPAINISSLPGVGPLKDSQAITQARHAVRTSLQMMTSPVFAQAFVLTFLGEWGDRSQITTIAMAGAHVSLGVGACIYNLPPRVVSLTPVCACYRIRYNPRTQRVHVVSSDGWAMGLHKAVSQAHHVHWCGFIFHLRHPLRCRGI